MGKKILLVNSVLGFGSTGHIVVDIAKEYEQKGYEVRIAYGRKGNNSDDARKYGIRIESDLGVKIHGVYTRLTDKHGLGSGLSTKKFLKWADSFDPDILWLHNIHGYYINYELLFKWIKARPQMQVKWTLHDCWSFTGHCSHFTYVKCDKWITGCHHCPQISQYPKSIRDNSVSNYNKKRELFTGVHNLTIITPSNWLKEIVQKSYLGDYPVEVIHNTIDKDVFKPVDSTFKYDYGIQDKKMILGVSSIWNERKGLNDFIELSKFIDSTKNQVVLVGLNENQIKKLKNDNVNILGLPRTSDVKELVKIYSAADVFVNPTYEDTFPTVNMEAEACGTPVLTYDTGGCSETICGSDSRCIDAELNALIENIKMWQ